MSSEEHHQKAGVWLRVKGSIADFIPLGIVYFFITSTLLRLEPPLTVVRVVSVVLTILWFSYFIYTNYKYNGRTIGKWVAKTRIVSEKGKLTIKQLLIRYGVLYGALFTADILGSLLFGPENILPFLVIIVFLFVMVFDEKNRGPHDLAAGTKVIKSS